MTRTCMAILLFVTLSGYSQQAPTADSLRKNYLSAQKAISNRFSAYYYPNRGAIYSLPEQRFLFTIDSLRAVFATNLQQYRLGSNQPDTSFITAEERDIDYFFDRMILDYPYFHATHTGQKITLSRTIQNRLDRHRIDFNNPALLSSRDVKDYIQAFLRHQSTAEVKKKDYKTSDNKRLDTYLNLIPRYFTNQRCKDYWQYFYLAAHLEDWGSKNTGPTISNFLKTCQNQQFKKEIDSLYNESAAARKDHLIKTYKTVSGYHLDMHLFLPDSTDKSIKRPVMVYFSGGSWTKGNPEWDFYNAAAYAKKGWIGVSVEYRVADRHETTPFEAVKDARSAIRWLRLHATEYNIDTHRIAASGNSAGGHLVLTTVLANNWNEATDNLHYSASPNIALVNAGVYNLKAEEATDWISRDLTDKTRITKISPFHLLRKGTPPILIIHGTNDQSVGHATAKAFADRMTQLGNDFEFHTLEGAPHYIWFDRRFSKQVSQLRSTFLVKHGYQ